MSRFQQMNSLLQMRILKFFELYQVICIENFFMSDNIFIIILLNLLELLFHFTCILFIIHWFNDFLFLASKTSLQNSVNESFVDIKTVFVLLLKFCFYERVDKSLNFFRTEIKSEKWENY